MNSEDNDLKRLKILDIQEKERSRVARELHDSSLQNLTHLIHMIEYSSMFIDKDPIRAKLELSSCTQNLRQIINDIRDTIFDLRPMSFDDLGFQQCIENYIDNLKIQFKNCEIIYEIDDIGFFENNSLFLVTLYRVLQEALLNALKHSNANKVELSIKNEKDKLNIKVIDNGDGFSVDQIKNQEKHFGISIMQERVYLLSGQFEIYSDLDKGTTVEITVPKP